MTVTLKLDHPHFPDDAEFGIDGLGRIMNHGTLEVDDDQVRLFETTRGMTVADAFVGNGIITVTGSSLTPETNKPSAEDAPTNVQTDSKTDVTTDAKTNVTTSVPTLAPQTETSEE